MAQKNFIKNTFTATKDGKTTLTGGQIIGWNPKLGRIVSWHFDAQGGFGNDVWTKDGSKWVIEATGVFRDGSESTAVNIITPVDANSFTWQSVKRTLDGVALPNTARSRCCEYSTASNAGRKPVGNGLRAVPCRRNASCAERHGVRSLQCRKPIRESLLRPSN